MKYGYGWVLKFILAAILIGVGIYMVFADEVVYLVTGIAIVIFSIFRVIPLMKSLNKEILRTINLIEIIFDTLIGAGMIYIVLSERNLADGIWREIYRFSLAFFFYARGLVYFNSVVFFKEKTEIPKFWVHIVSLSIGAIIAFQPNFDYNTVGIFLLLISIVGASYLGYDGFGGYKKYRQYQKELNQEKEKNKPKEIDPESPQPAIIDEKKEDKRPYVN
ncbi:MAG: hypothetical protein EP317_06035 [Bacillota bacterium]|nr:MAG: hypothetical protein EP317_06035 [Bacillota bacterium]